jgi:hypothetical protein
MSFAVSQPRLLYPLLQCKMTSESDDDDENANGKRQSDHEMIIPSSTGRAKRPRCHPLHRRLLRIPTPNDWETSSRLFDSYEDPPSFSGFIDHRRPRPMPSSLVLTSTIGTNDTSHKAPILQDFFQAVGIPNKQSATTDEKDKDDDDDVENEGNSPHQDDIDNPNLSKLTAGQHERYLRLLSSSTARTTAERKEYHILSQLVRSEQARYRQALQDFHAKNLDRYRSMDSKSAAFPFFQWACRPVSKPLQQAHLSVSKFGKCRQNISLPQPQQASNNALNRLDLASLKLQVVHTTEMTDTFPTITDELTLVGKRIQSPTTTNTPTHIPISEDKHIQSLAKEYNASIVTTVETLQTLLKRPSSYVSRWMVPYTKQESSGIRLLGPPIPQAFTTPRDCLEYGLQEGLYQSLQTPKHGTTTTTTTSSSSSMIQYVYTLWTLPTVRRRQTVRVLIRSAVRCRHSKDDGPIVILRPHAEYFVRDRHVQDIPNSFERALWILDQLLLGGGDVYCQWVRVDAQTCEIVECKRVSIAHALAMDDYDDNDNNDNDGNNDPIHPLESLIHILQSLPTIDVDQKASLLGLNPQQHSVSVHAAASSSNDAVTIDLEGIPDANGVVLSTEALKHCARDWKWDRTDRVPNTFPVYKDSQQKKGVP